MEHSISSSRGLEPGHIHDTVWKRVKEVEKELGKKLSSDGKLAMQGNGLAMAALLYLTDVEERVYALEEEARSRGAKLLAPNVVMLGRLAEQSTKKRARWDYVRKDWAMVG